MNQKRAHEVAETCRQWENNENWHNTPEMQAAIVLDNRVEELEADIKTAGIQNSVLCNRLQEAQARIRDLEAQLQKEKS